MYLSNVRRAPNTMACACGWQGVSLAHHLSKAGLCRLVAPLRNDPHQPASGDALDSVYEHELRAHVFKGFGPLYYRHKVEARHIDIIREAVKDWVAFASAQVIRDIEIAHGIEVGKSVARSLKKRTNFFSRLETEDQVRGYIVAEMPMVPAVMSNHFPDGTHANGIFIVDWLTALLRQPSKEAAEIIARSELWKSGAKATPPPDGVMRSMDDGAGFRQHVFAQKDPDKPGEPPTLKVRHHGCTRTGT